MSAHNRSVILPLLWLLMASSALAADSEAPIDKSPPKGMTVDQLVQRFTAKEKQWKTLREKYSFRQSIHVKAMEGNEVKGEYQHVADFHFQNGVWARNVVIAPQPSVDVSPEDLQDLESRVSFTISTDELPIYNVTYVGQQKVDELHCYVFDVAPKSIEKAQRYFEGRIWVDDQDFQIVKNSGKSVPDIRIKKKKKIQENLFPKFTTWREQVAEGYWFPTFSSADDILHFQTQDLHIKEALRFTDYKRSDSGLTPAK